MKPHRRAIPGSGESVAPLFLAIAHSARIAPQTLAAMCRIEPLAFIGKHAQFPVPLLPRRRFDGNWI
jgi:hypothetical protein